MAWSSNPISTMAHPGAAGPRQVLFIFKRGGVGAGMLWWLFLFHFIFILFFPFPFSSFQNSSAAPNLVGFSPRPPTIAPFCFLDGGRLHPGNAFFLSFFNSPTFGYFSPSFSHSPSYWQPPSNQYSMHCVRFTTRSPSPNFFCFLCGWGCHPVTPLFFFPPTWYLLLTFSPPHSLVSHRPPAPAHS